MGGGASRQGLLQRSDSRLDALLAEARREETSNDRLRQLALDKIPPELRIDLHSLKRPATGRLSRYAEQRMCHDTTEYLHEGEVAVSDDAVAVEADDNKSDEKGGRAGEKEEEQEEEDYSTDDFEDDEVSEWKKGASIGAGSYGTVYLARDEDTGSLMAVKELLISEESETAIHEATREVELLRSLKHENIVKYMGCHVDNKAQTLSIFTEWVPGGSLEHNRKLFGGNERVVRRFTHQLLSGVAYLHSKNIIHHDIKPANILVDQNGVVKIADFGSSRLISSATLASSSTQSLRGTPNYMAPEVIKQTAGRSRKADIWSIGCTVLRLLTGCPLWGDRHFDSQAALLYYIANMEELPPLPEGLSLKAREFILACLQIDPAERPSALELLKFPFALSSGHKTDSVIPEPLTVTTRRRHTAPTVSSPVVSPDHRPRRSDRQHEYSKETEVRPMDSRPSLRRRSSLVATLFSPSDGHTTSPRKDAPEKEEAEVAAATSESSADIVVTSWDDQPILSAAARKDREQLQEEEAEAARRRQERERKFQEELDAYRHDSFAGRA